MTMLTLPASAGQGPLGPARRGDWRTPRAFFDLLDREFRFVLDACALAPIRPDIAFLTPELDGLWQPWTPGPVFLNPPYGRSLLDWLAKAASECQLRGVTTVALVPARIDTFWWHDVVMRDAAEVRVIRGRLKFDDGDGNPPFASVVVVFRPGHTGPPCLRVQAGALS